MQRTRRFRGGLREKTQERDGCVFQKELSTPMKKSIFETKTEDIRAVEEGIGSRYYRLYRRRIPRRLEENSLSCDSGKISVSAQGDLHSASQRRNE